MFDVFYSAISAGLETIEPFTFDQIYGAHRRAARGSHWNFDGAHYLWICRAKNMVASSCDHDVHLDYCLRIDPRRIQFDSSGDHVARDYQWHSLWWRICLVFLPQTERRRVFLRT